MSRSRSPTIIIVGLRLAYLDTIHIHIHILIYGLKRLFTDSYPYPTVWTQRLYTDSYRAGGIYTDSRWVGRLYLKRAEVGELR